MHIDVFLQSAVLLLLVTSAMVALTKYLGLGSVLGLLLAGVIIGPHSPGPHITEHVEDARNFAELGTILLLFLIGLEMQPARLWAMRRELFGLGLLQILISGLLIAVYLFLFSFSWAMCLLGGFTLALSSTAFAIQILQERGEIASRHGRATFSVLLMQDLAVVPLLALIPILAGGNATDSQLVWWEQASIMVGIAVLVGFFGRYVIPWALQYLASQGNHEGFTMVVLLAVLAAAWAMHKTGLSMAFGAFAMGMLLSGSRYNYQIEAQIEPNKGLLMSLFFVAVGMSIDFAPIMAAPLWFITHILVLIFIKFLVLFGLGLIFGLKATEAIRIGVLLTQAGEFGFVLFGSAHNLGLMDDMTFALAVGVVSTSMLITPLLVRMGDNLVRWLDSRPTPMQQPVIEPGEPRQVIIAGYGRVGHTIAVILHSTGIPFIAFDNDPEQVSKGQRDGFSVYFGNINESALWDAAHAQEAALVVLTIGSATTAMRAVSYLRSSFPELQIISRARDLQVCGQLLEAGANHAFPEMVESSMRLGAQVLEMLGTPSANVNLLLSGVRSTNYSLVREDNIP